MYSILYNTPKPSHLLCRPQQTYRMQQINSYRKKQFLFVPSLALHLFMDFKSSVMMVIASQRWSYGKHVYQVRRTRAKREALAKTYASRRRGMARLFGGKVGLRLMSLWIYGEKNREHSRSVYETDDHAPVEKKNTLCFLEGSILLKLLSSNAWT